MSKYEIIGEGGERNPEIVEEIEEVLEEKLPPLLKGSGVFDENGFEFQTEEYDWDWDSQIGTFIIKACALGDNNFYDCNEEPKEPKIDILEIAKLFQKYPKYFHIEECCECRKCIGWE